MGDTMRQQRFWSKRRTFTQPAKRSLQIALSERGIYEPVLLEKHVVEEIIALLWFNQIPVFQERERIPVCQKCGARVCKPSEAGHPDLHGWIPARKMTSIDHPFGTGHALPFYIECKRPQGGIESAVQKKFIADAKRDGVLALFARSWGDVKFAFSEIGISLNGGLNVQKKTADQ